MRSKFYLNLLVLLTYSAVSQAQNIIYDSGSPISHSGTNFDTSFVQDVTLSMNTFGWLHQNNYRIADEFAISEDVVIDSIAFYAFVPGTNTNSTLTGYFLQIWDGNPSDSTSSVVWGNTTTNLLSSTSFANAYRMVESAPFFLSRPIMRSFADLGGLQLNAGTYWLDWSVTTSSGNTFAVPITIAGQDTTGNALRFDPFLPGWLEVKDNNAPQGMPFQIYGSIDATSDVGIVAITQPASGVLTASESITVRVANFDTNPVDSIPVSVQIDGGAITSEVITASIAGGDSLDYTFTNTFDLSASGDYTITAWVSLPDDVDSSNDTLSITVTNNLSVADFVTSSFSVYPNPTTEHLNIDSHGTITELRLMDQSGRVLYHELPNTTSCKLSFETIPAGTYVLQLMVDGVWHTQKVVRQ
jgi:hypothetical protein